VEASGGRLTLVSSGEGGSVFRVTLPRAPQVRLKPDTTVREASPLRRSG
jgi:hypothetical protein